jgi:GxxExxY protein
MTLSAAKSTLDENQERIISQIIDSAFQVHKYFGPGLNERIYEEALIREFDDRQISYERQKAILIYYGRHNLGLEYKLDLLVDGKIVVELKCVDCLLPLHKSQIMSYMRLVQSRAGLLINFNSPTLKEGLKRIVI